jgi:hypothetical protein
MARKRLQVCEVSGVRQFVIVDDLVSVVKRKNMPDEIGTDKTGAASYKDFHRSVSFSAIRYPL